LPKVKVRYVDASPEELAYDAPRDVSDPKRFPTITRDAKDWRKFLTFRNGYARLKPMLRQAFPTDAAVNEALEFVLKVRKSPAVSGGQRKRA
jgi:hypothetical protein